MEKQMLTKKMKEWIENNPGVYPSSVHFKGENGMPSAYQFYIKFGTWSAALEAAGYKKSKYKKYEIYNIDLEKTHLKLKGFNDAQVAAILINMVRRRVNTVKPYERIKLINVKEVMANGTLQNEKK